MAKKLAQELFDLNRAHSELYVQQEAARIRYHQRYPTNVAAFKCMDGRVNMPLLTRAPLGAVRPFRNIGGKFRIGWSALEGKLVEYVDQSARKGRSNLFLATYHWSEGEPHRGCRGHHYDVTEARACAMDLTDQLRRVFGDQQGIYPVMVGVETDSQALVFHNRDGGVECVSMADVEPGDEEAVREVIRTLYPDMPRDIVGSLMPLMSGNVEHAAEVRARHDAPIDLDHRERVIAVGAGFDWLHKPNLALIINDLEMTLDDTIAAAAGIIKENRDTRRIHHDSALYFASVPYKRPGYERNAAIERARYLAQLGKESIERAHPDLKGFFTYMTAVMNWESRRLELVDE
jgi:hypothetical protein